MDYQNRKIRTVSKSLKMFLMAVGEKVSAKNAFCVSSKIVEKSGKTVAILQSQKEKRNFMNSIIDERY